ncbi:adenylate/guanylate cyclase domain-containing protein [Mycobacterium heckeshornense]|nr:adenylate/guanylate cyclase domain-containing protein [Mycobacterium heckeshornense]
MTRPVSAEPTTPTAAQPRASGEVLLGSWWALPTLTLGSNLCGAAIVITLMVLSGAPDRLGAALWTLVGVLAAVISAGLAGGAVILDALRRRSTAWIGQHRPPTCREARDVLRLPHRTSLVVAALWLGGIAIMTAAALMIAPPAEAVRGAGLSGLAAVASIGYNYLFVDRAIRPVAAQALLVAPRTDFAYSSVTARLVLTWLLSTALPLLAGLILLNDPAADLIDRIRAATYLAVLALMAGVIAELVLARAVALPLRQLRAALDKLGSAEVHVPVDDSGEIGALQSTVNEMSRTIAERGRLQELFTRHVGWHVAAHAVAIGAEPAGELRNVAALFIDVCESTAMAYQHSPHDVVAKLNRLFADVIAASEGHGGLVNKFDGDAALCVFGAPQELDDDATAALQAAREIRDNTVDRGELDIGIGVAKGPVFAGNLGTEQRLEYTVIGDAINEAARLTELAKKTPGRILATDALIAAADLTERRNWQRHKNYKLRGRPTPTPTWTIDAPTSQRSHDQMPTHSA